MIQPHTCHCPLRFLLCQFLLLIYCCLLLDFFFHVSFLFPLVAFKGSLQRIYTRRPKNCYSVYVDCSFPATDKRQEGVGPEIRRCSWWEGLLICLLSPGKAFAKSCEFWWGMLCALLKYGKGCLIMDTR